jgi:alpha/beta superfamily hydrolase
MATIERYTDDELRAFARRIITREVYVAWTQDAIEYSFGAMIALSAGMLPDEDVQNIGLIWAEEKNANAMCVNGYPTFFQMAFIHKDDVEPLVAHLQRMEEALGPPTPQEAT